MGFAGKTMGKTSAENKDRKYVLRQCVLKEGPVGAEMVPSDVTAVEDIINTQCERGYRVCQMNSIAVDTKGIGGGDRTLIFILFEKIDA